MTGIRLGIQPLILNPKQMTHFFAPSLRFSETVNLNRFYRIDNPEDYEYAMMNWLYHKLLQPVLNIKAADLEMTFTYHASRRERYVLVNIEGNKVTCKVHS